MRRRKGSLLGREDSTCQGPAVDREEVCAAGWKRQRELGSKRRRWGRRPRQGQTLWAVLEVLAPGGW